LPVATGDGTRATEDQVSDAAKTTDTLFDPGWIESSKDPATSTVHFDYTAQGWQTCRIPYNRCGGLDTSLQQSWSYYPDATTASYPAQGGQSPTYHYDAANKLTYAKPLHGASQAQSPIEIYADDTGYDQPKATHYRPTSASTYTGTAYSYDHDGNVSERDDNATQTLTSQTLNGDGVPISWTFTQTSSGAPVVNTMSYDPADWLTLQNNNGTSSSCTGRQRVTTDWTAAGWESARTISGADSACTYTTKQKTTWTYFDNGKLNTDKITNGAGTVLETHTVGYETNGIYLNGNRTSDAFALNGPSSNVCTGSTPSCTATYTYDARDRLKGYTDGH